VTNSEEDDFQIVRGSGNVYADIGLPNSQSRQLRGILAAEISKTLASQKLTLRAAEKLSGCPAADFSRIRQAKLSGFTIDRLMSILDHLNQEIKIEVSVTPKHLSDLGAMA
jgi:predicted XRE-type DNA-binding protein